METHKIEPLVEAAKAAPPISIVGLQVLGYSLNEWLTMGSLVLIGLQIFFLIREKIYLPWKAKRGL